VLNVLNEKVAMCSESAGMAAVCGSWFHSLGVAVLSLILAAHFFLWRAQDLPYFSLLESSPGTLPVSQ